MRQSARLGLRDSIQTVKENDFCMNSVTESKIEFFNFIPPEKPFSESVAQLAQKFHRKARTRSLSSSFMLTCFSSFGIKPRNRSTDQSFKYIFVHRAPR